MSKKNQPWSERVPCLTFREPRANEFGYKHCKKSLLYIETSFEEKPITWFLGMDEYSHQSMWRSSSSSFDFDPFATYHARISGPSSYHDGTLPTDDISVDDVKIGHDSSDRTKDNYNVFGSLWMNDSLFKSSSEECYAVITDRLKPEDLIAEVKSSLVLKTISSFQSFISTMTNMRYQTSTFAAEKKFCSNFMANSRFRSINLLEDAKDTYWEEHRGDEGIKATTLCTIEDDEALQLFTTPRGHISSHHFFNFIKPSFMDQRYLISIATNDNIKSLTLSSKLYIGRLDIKTSNSEEKSNIIKDLAIVIKPRTGQNALIKISFNHDFSIFDAYAINTVKYVGRSGGYGYNRNQGSVSGDTQAALKILDQLVESSSEQVVSEYEEIPGYIPGLDSENIEDFFQKICSIAQTSGIEVLPFPKGNDSSNDWDSILKKTVTISKDNTTVLRIAPLPNNAYGSYTHLDLNTLEDRINEIFIDYPSLSFRRKTSGSLEERRVGIASKLDKLYSVLEPFLVYTIKYSLGNTSINRPFILVKSSDNNSYRNSDYFLSTWHLEHHNRATYKSDPSSKYTFSPKYFLMIVRLYEELECFNTLTSQIKSELEDEHKRRPYDHDWQKACGEEPDEKDDRNKRWLFNAHEGLSMINHFDWELGAVILYNLLDNNKVSYSLTSLDDNIYITEKISLDLLSLVRGSSKLNGIFQILMATALELSIENDTFINFSKRVKLLTPKDVIIHILSSESSREDNLEKVALRSIYAK